jgi:eukaryotic-like serine/threonine-protein kinase
LDTGTRFGPYEILSPLGAGGMGEVYRARDTRLGRDVAVKVLPDAVASDPERRARFEREARAIAALDHPHICAIYDVGEAHGTHYLVMPLLDGQTLEARLAIGALPLDQALAIAGQIADALDKAHRRGIVHRDLKPANVMLTKTGATLLDFGLAKLKVPGGPIGLTGPHRAATTAAGTAEGTILGTLHYMAPEQVEGKEADARSDIWALGAVLYEMVTGVRPFQGDTAASVIGSILKDHPPTVSSRQPVSPPLLDRVVGRCLEKDPDRRWQSAADVGHALLWATDPKQPASPSPAGTRRPWFVVGAALVAGIGLGLVAPSWRGAASAPIRDVRFLVYPEPGSELSPPAVSVMAPQFGLSHDGRHLAFVATSAGQPMLWVRPLAATTSRMLPGTENATYPFWMPDGVTIGFFAQSRFKVVRIDGGTARVVTSASFDPRGGAAAPDGTTLVNLVANQGLARVASDGSTDVAAPLNTAAGETGLRFPFFLPDSRHFVALVRNTNDNKRGLVLGTLDDRARSTLTSSDWGGAVLDNFLLYLQGSTLMRQRLDVSAARLTGDAVPLLDGIGGSTSGYPALSVSYTGTLAYAEPWPTLGELVWFDRTGRRGATVGPLADYIDFAPSPDGRHLAVSRVDPQTNTGDVWLLDFERGAEMRLTAHRLNDTGPMWSADGRRVFFRSNRRGVNSLWVKPADASRPEELMFEHDAISSMISISISADASRMLFSTTGRESSWDVWQLPLAPSSAATPVLQGPFNESGAALSPDGRWLAFSSDETGRQQVYVQSFPGGEQRQQVSSRGGTEPQWRADGRELFFLGENAALMATPVSDGRAGVPVELFRTRVPATGNAYRFPYRASPDGQRFLINTTPEVVVRPAIHVVLDWRALLPK